MKGLYMKFRRMTLYFELFVVIICLTIPAYSVGTSRTYPKDIKQYMDKYEYSRAYDLLVEMQSIYPNDELFNSHSTYQELPEQSVADDSVTSLRKFNKAKLIIENNIIASFTIETALGEYSHEYKRDGYILASIDNLARYAQRKKDFATAILIKKDLLVLNNKCKYDEQLIKVLEIVGSYELGVLYQLNNDKDNALRCFNQSLIKLESIDDKNKYLIKNKSEFYNELSAAIKDKLDKVNLEKK
jgi:hypothetical protein